MSFKITTLSLGLAIALVSCQAPEKQDTRKGDAVKIGMIAPFTGEGATYGESLKRGFDLALDDADNIEVIYEDSKLDAPTAVTAINKLISIDNVDLIYGAAASGVTTAIVPIADQSETVIFSSISTSDGLSEASPYFFRNVPKNALQGFTAAKFLADDPSIETVAIFNENDEFGVNITDSFKKYATEFGLSIVYENTYLSTDTNFRNQLSRIKQEGADALYIPGNYEESGIILRQAAEIGLDSTIMAGDGSYSPALIDYAGASAEGFLVTLMGVDKSSKVYADFHSKFVSKYGDEPNVNEIYAFEAGEIMQMAIEQASNEDYQSFLKGSEFTTFSGPLSFVGSDMVRPYGVSVVDGGEFKDFE